MSKRKTKDTEQVDVGALSESFSAQIKQQDEMLYGVALFFECISLLNSGQDAVIETYRKQFRNIIQSGKTAIEEATALLEQVAADTSKAELISQFAFHACSGHPDPQGLTRRALILAKEYSRLFPDRPRDKAFEKSELMQLIEAAAVDLD